MRPLATSLALVLLAGPPLVPALYSLTKSYNSTTFLSGFDLVPDAAATTAALIHLSQSSVDIGVDGDGDGDDASNDNPAAAAVRFRSRSDFGNSLIIARFTHMPEAACGGQASFMTESSDGKADSIVIHTSKQGSQPTVSTSDRLGTCKRELAPDPDPVQFVPCDKNAGGIYAILRSDEHIRVYSWPQSDAPENLDSPTPDPKSKSWGQPLMELRNSSCALDLFSRQRLVLDLRFGSDAQDKPTDSAASSLQPRSFRSSYWGIRDIRVFEHVDAKGSQAPAAKSESEKTAVLPDLAKTSNVLPPSNAATDKQSLEKIVEPIPKKDDEPVASGGEPLQANPVVNADLKEPSQPVVSQNVAQNQQPVSNVAANNSPTMMHQPEAAVIPNSAGTETTTDDVTLGQVLGGVAGDLMKAYMDSRMNQDESQQNGPAVLPQQNSPMPPAAPASPMALHAANMESPPVNHIPPPPPPPTYPVQPLPPYPVQPSPPYPVQPPTNFVPPQAYPPMTQQGYQAAPLPVNQANRRVFKYQRKGLFGKSKSVQIS